MWREFVEFIARFFRKAPAPPPEPPPIITPATAPVVVRSPERIIAESHAAYLDYPYLDTEDRQRVGEAYAEQCADEIEELIAQLAKLPKRADFKKPVYGIHLDSIHRLVGFQIAQLTPEKLSRPLDFQHTGAAVGEMEPSRRGISVKRYRILTPREVRGRVLGYHKHFIESRWVSIVGQKRYEDSIIYGYEDERDGSWQAVSAPQMTYTHDKWNLWLPTARLTPQEDLVQTKLAIGLQYLSEFYWLAYFTSPNSYFSLQVALKPQTALNLFKHREKPTHAKRRKALAHLVSPHWRDVPTQAEETEIQVFVREHSRGTDWFDWLGLECAVVPALRDIQRLNFAKIERQLLKKSGSDRRQKV